MNREELEQAAVQEICACWYYDFDPSVESDERLQAIIETKGQVIHDYYGETCDVNS